MELTYELYCLADRTFYDDPNLAPLKSNPDFPFAQEPVPAGWERAEFDHWVSYTPDGAALPPQGWKVHVASCLDNAEALLATVCDYCIPRRIAFKFVRGPEHLFLANTKYADRGSSGKFVAIYPADESQLMTVLIELGDLLDGQPGPYILSDLRWASGPLYVRYGGFAERWCVGPSGDLELAIEGPGGELIPDRRDVVFRVPEWVSLPTILAPHLAARNGTTVNDMPYEIREALHFSNGGGVYVGYRGEERFVLKEARPHAGLDLARRDALIDFEGASDAGESRRQVLANAAFAPPSGRTGLDADRYALACLRLYLFMPLTQLLALGSSKASELAEAIAERFGVPAAFLDETVRWIAGDVPPGEPSAPLAPATLLEPAAGNWRSVAASMAGAILSSATPERDDRLFPGDPMQFYAGALNLAHGVAGVLYSLDAVGCGRYPAHEDWLVERALHPRRTPRFGFYDGLHGVAHALDRLGRRSEALEVLQRCRRELAGSLDRLGLDLEGGLAGIGLNLSHFASVTGDGLLEDAADEVVRIVANRLGDEQSVSTISGGEHPYAGLMRGSSGPALLFIRRYERTGDDRLLDLAATALRQDLRRCVVRPEGTLEVEEGWRTLPYIDRG